MPAIEGFLYDFVKMIRQGRKDLLEVLDAIQYSHNPPEVGHIARMTGLDHRYVRRVLENLKNAGVRARVDYSLQKLGLKYVTFENFGSGGTYVSISNALKSRIKTATGSLTIYSVPSQHDVDLIAYALKKMNLHNSRRIVLSVFDEVVLSKPSFSYYFESSRDMNPAIALELIDNHPRVPIIEEKIYRSFSTTSSSIHTTQNRYGFRDLLDLMILAGLEIDSLSIQKSIIYVMKTLHKMNFPMRKYTKHKKHITSLIDGFKVLAFDRPGSPGIIIYVKAESTSCIRNIAMMFSHYLYTSQIVYSTNPNNIKSIEEEIRNLVNLKNLRIDIFDLALVVVTEPIYIYGIIEKIKEMCEVTDTLVSFFIPEVGGVKNYVLPYMMYSPIKGSWIVKELS